MKKHIAQAFVYLGEAEMWRFPISGLLCEMLVIEYRKHNTGHDNCGSI